MKVTLRKKKLVIDRTKWFRGNGARASRLLITDETLLQAYVKDKSEALGKMCCLGFYSLACGLTKGQIANVEMPSNIAEMLPVEMAWLLSRTAVEIAKVNDDSLMSDAEREKYLTEKFATHDVEVEFIN